MGNSLKVKRSVDNPSYTFDFIQCRTRFLSQVIAYKTDISIYLSSFFLFKLKSTFYRNVVIFYKDRNIR